MLCLLLYLEILGGFALFDGGSLDFGNLDTADDANGAKHFQE